MRKVLSMVLMLALNACSLVTSRMVVYNGCKGSWIRVADGEGHVLAGRIDYGQPATIELPYGGSYGRNFTLLAYGYSVYNGDALGSARWGGWIQGSGGDITASRNQQEPWRITFLESNTSGGGCQR